MAHVGWQIVRCKGAASIANTEELKPRAESGVGAQLKARALLLLASNFHTL